MSEGHRLPQGGKGVGGIKKVKWSRSLAWVRCQKTTRGRKAAADKQQ